MAEKNSGTSITQNNCTAKLLAANKQSSVSQMVALIILVMTIQSILVEAAAYMRSNKPLTDGDNQANRLTNTQIRLIDRRIQPKGISTQQLSSNKQTRNQNEPSARFEASSRSLASTGGGQLEAFSTDWTGLGDLEASDALRKMNRRRRRSHELSSRLQVGSRRPSAYLSKRAQLYALQQVETPADRLLGPILLSRRTEDLLEPEQAAGSGMVDLRDGNDKESTFPLLGEFGSKISLLTTRKTEPNAGALFGAYRTTLGALDSGWSPTNEMEEDSIPMSSQVLISPQQLSSMSKNIEDAILAAATEAGARNNQAATGARLAALGNQNPGTVSIMESLSSNYLPRIARKVII